MLLVVLQHQHLMSRRDVQRAQNISIGSVKGFDALVMSSQFITTTRLALGQKVVFNSTTYPIPSEFKQTHSRKVGAQCR